MLVVLGSALVPKKMKEADRKTIRCIRFIVIQRFKIINNALGFLLRLEVCGKVKPRAFLA